jgi:hypothetical protein
MTGFEMTRFEVFKAYKYEILLAPYQSFSLKLESRHLVISSSRHLVISSSRHLVISSSRHLVISSSRISVTNH